jgi:hypothetical protein
MKRRSVFRWLLALLIIPVSYPLIRRIRRHRSDTAEAWDRDVRILRSEYAEDLKALTRSLLPSSLGAERADAVALDFIRWLESQNPEAELSHLGFRLRRDDIARLKPGTRRGVIDGSNYRRQLEQLRGQTHPRRLTQVDRVELTLLLTSALQTSGAREIPPGPVGDNLLVDVLSFFYRQPVATDLFHGRRIAALSCRGLDGVDRLPASLTVNA